MEFANVIGTRASPCVYRASLCKHAPLTEEPLIKELKRRANVVEIFCGQALKKPVCPPPPVNTFVKQYNLIRRFDGLRKANKCKI